MNVNGFIPPTTAPAILLADNKGGGGTNGGQRQKFLGNNGLPLGRGGWPKEDPLHDPLVIFD